jgi:hypothetical protein
MTTRPTSSTRAGTTGSRLRRAGATAIIGAGLIAIGAVSLAPIANAIPEKTIKSDCKSANGTYHSGTANGHTYSSCTFKDVDGDTYTDTDVDGAYTGQDPYRVGGAAPVTQKPGSVPGVQVSLG